MENLSLALQVIQAISISLGVGSSTLAVLNFFNAIADGTIEQTERRMMGMTYIVLRVAMVLILVSTLGLLSIQYASGEILTIDILAQLFLTTVLFVNAYLMTVHLMPSTFGPAIQAGTWYLLGFGMALAGIGYAVFSATTFLLVYISVLLFATTLINVVMQQLKKRNTGKQTTS